MNISFRPAIPDDLGFLYELYASTRQEEVAAFGWNAAEQETFFRLQFAARQHAYRIQFPDAACTLALSADGRRAAAMILNRTADELRVVDIAVLTPHQNQGIGTALLERAIGEAQREQKPLRLQVLRQNQRAAKLYQKLGFEFTGEDALYFQMERRAGA